MNVYRHFYGKQLMIDLFLRNYEIFAILVSYLRKHN